jgi:hypothetical protein
MAITVNGEESITANSYKFPLNADVDDYDNNNNDNNNLT